MKVVVVKNSKESNERLITRFNKAVQKSRKVQLIRETRYHRKSPRKWYVRDAAIMREKYRSDREKNKFY